MTMLSSSKTIAILIWFIKEMALEIEHGINTIVTGPKDCCKNFLICALNGLWNFRRILKGA
jgi:ABC-type uncharacterized transport system fused permease/ATPase subunit